MNTMLKTAIFVTALLMLGGCATKALTPEEQAFQEWCMEGKGYTKDQLKSIWY